MNGRIYLKSSGGDDRALVQSAFDEARKNGGGTVVLEGDFLVSGTLYVGESTAVILKNGTLRALDRSVPVLTNSNRLLPRARTIYGSQRGICVIGEQGCISGRIELVNVSDFTVRGLTFTDCDTGIFLAYATGGRLLELSFKGVRRCIDADIGTRNCFFNGISSQDCDSSIAFSSVRREDVVVCYFGPDVMNNVVRDLFSEVKPTFDGEYCYNNVIV